MPWAEAKSLNQFYKHANDQKHYISLVGFSIDEDNLATLASYISTSQSLIGVNFTDNQLGDEGFKQLLQMIYNDGGRQLEVLAVVQNNVTTSSVKVLGKIIGTTICNLRRLSLAKNPLKDSFVKQFMKFFKSNESLYELDLSESQITFAGLKIMLRYLKFNVSILQLHLEDVDEHDLKEEFASISQFNTYSTRLLTSTKKGRKMRPKARKEMERITLLADGCIQRNLKIRFARSRCADLLRKGSYPVKLNASRLTILGNEESGKTGVAHTLLDTLPHYYPSYNPTISLAQSALQTFQKEPPRFNDMIKHLQPHMSLAAKEKFYSKLKLMPFTSPAKTFVTLGEQKQTDNQIWKAKRKEFGGLVALCALREAKEAAESAFTEIDDTLEGQGKHLYSNPESLNSHIEQMASLYSLNAFDKDKESVILPHVRLDSLSVSSFQEHQSSFNVAATLQAAVNDKTNQVNKLDYLFDAVESQGLATTVAHSSTWGEDEDRSHNTRTIAGVEDARTETPSHKAKNKYSNFKKSNQTRFPGYGATPSALKIATSGGLDEETDKLLNNQIVNEQTIRDIANVEILLRSYFSDTLIFSLFDLGSGEMAEMLARFAITENNLNIMVVDLERAAKSSLQDQDIQRDELTIWYRCVELFGGKDAPLIIVGTKLDEVRHIVEAPFGEGTTTKRRAKARKGKVSNDMAQGRLNHIMKGIDTNIVKTVIREDNRNLMRNKELDLSYFPMSNIDFRGIAPVRALCEKFTRNLASLDENLVPLRWVRFLEIIFEKYNSNKNVNYKLSMRVFVKLALSIGFTCKAEIQAFLIKFDNLGFILFKKYNYELTEWVVIDPIPIFKRLLVFTQCFDKKFASNSSAQTRKSKLVQDIENKLPTEITLLRNHGLVRKNLFKLLWNSQTQEPSKEDLNFGVSFLKQHYFMTEFILNGERFFLFPSFIRKPQYFPPSSPLVPGPIERYYFAVSFNQTGYIPPAMLPRLYSLLITLTIQENIVTTSSQFNENMIVPPMYNIFSQANTHSKIYLSKNKIRIYFGGQMISLTVEGNELIVGLTDPKTATRIAIIIHSMLAKLNNDIFNDKMFWDIIFFEPNRGSKLFSTTATMATMNLAGGGYSGQPPSPGFRRPMTTTTFAGESTFSADYENSPGLVAYEEDEVVEDYGITGTRVRMSFNEARNKKIYPFFKNETDSYEVCYNLWKGSRNSSEARDNFKENKMSESVEDYCNTLKKKYLSNSF